MKQDKNKIIAMILALIVIIGIIMVAVKGFAFDLTYQKAKRVEFALNQNFEIKDIKQITDEVLNDQKVVIQKIEVFEDAVSILAKDITDEQKQELVNKLNEKYTTEFTTEEIEIEEVDNFRGRDLIKPYIMPFVVATILVLAYIAIRYHSLGIKRVIGKTIVGIVVSQVVLASIMAIVRIPVGKLTIPMVLIVYIVSLYISVSSFEKKMAKRENEVISESEI